VALGLALAAAEVRNQPVLLIDGNFSHPRYAKLLLAGTPWAGRLPGWKHRPQECGEGYQHPAHAGDERRSGAAQSPQYAGVVCLQKLLDSLSEAFPFIIIDGRHYGFAESVLYAAQVDRVLLVIKSVSPRAGCVNGLDKTWRRRM